MSKTTSGSILNIIVLYGALILGFLGTFMKARIITPAEIGVLSSLVTISALAGFFLNLGTPVGIIKYSPELRDDKHELTGFYVFNLLLSLCAYVLVCTGFIVFRSYVLKYFHDELLAKYFDFVFILMIGEVFNNQFRSIYQVFKRSVSANVIYNITTRSANIVMLCFMYFGFFDFYTFLLVDILSVVFKSVLFVAGYLRFGVVALPSFRFLSKKFLKKYFNYSFYMLFSGVIALLVNSIDKIMIGHYVDMAGVGVYRVVLTFIVLIEFIGKGFSMTNSPLIASYWRKEEVGKLKKLYNENVNQQLILGLFAFSALIAFGTDLLTILGKAYETGFYVLLFLSLGELINVGTGLSGAIISFSRYYKLEFYIRILLVVLTYFTNTLFIPIWGVSGAAFATMLSVFLCNLVQFIFVSWYLKLQPYDLESVRILLLNALMALAFWGVKHIFGKSSIPAIIGISAVLFLIYLWLGIYLFKLPNMKSSVQKIFRRKASAPAEQD